MAFIPAVGAAFAPLIGGTTAAAGATAAGTGLSFSSVVGAGTAVLGGLAKVGTSRYQAAVAEINADAAAETARRATQSAQIEQQDQDAITAGLVGQTAAIQGASGFDVSSGSSRKARATGRRLGRIDALNIRQRGNDEAENARRQEAGFLSERSAAKASIAPTLFGAFLEGGASLIGGATPTRRARVRRLV